MFRRTSRASSAGPQEKAQAAKIAELTASRRQVAQAYERERRRIERDLHDGAQQYFVAASMALTEAQLIAEETGREVEESLVRAGKLIDDGLTRLRDTVRGIHPRVLSDLGLAAAIEASAASFSNPVTVRCPHPLPTLDPAVLASAYFFATEALTNAAKHAPGASVTVLLTADTDLRISVVDTGPGGARVVPRGGLAEMRGRLTAFDGTVELISPRGGPTKVVASIPMMLRRGEPGYGEKER